MLVNSIVTSSSKTSEPSRLVLRKPHVDDGAKIHALINKCKPLELNSVYSYLLLCKHFADTCVVAEEDGEILAFLSGYCLPSDHEVFFVWQVAVDSRIRDRGLGKRLLHEVLQRKTCQSCHFLETTITLSNTASLRLFWSIARDLDAHCEESVYFSEELFGQKNHEAEYLFRIGPFNVNQEERT